MNPSESAPLIEKFYGRRVGRQATACRAYVQRVLPPWNLSLGDLHAVHKAVCSWDLFFPKPCRAFWMEIGFGFGEHLQALMQRHLDVGFIGVEPFVNGLSALLRGIEEEPALYEGRLRLIGEDVRPFLPAFPVGQLERLYVLFSDPWPKKRHHKRRLIDGPFLQTCARLLQPGGELRIAHDHAPYMREILTLLHQQDVLRWKAGLQLPESPFWPPWPEDWPLTRYGEKALSRGRPLAFSVWEKSVTVECVLADR